MDKSPRSQRHRTFVAYFFVLIAAVSGVAIISVLPVWAIPPFAIIWIIGTAAAIALLASSDDDDD
jgi:type IV secretory pathway component VirB8